MVSVPGIGVDDTRMDLSQFDEAGRSVPGASHSPLQPDIIITAGSPEELEQASLFIEGTDVVPAPETTRRLVPII